MTRELIGVYAQMSSLKSHDPVTSAFPSGETSRQLILRDVLLTTPADNFTPREPVFMRRVGVVSESIVKANFCGQGIPCQQLWFVIACNIMSCQACIWVQRAHTREDPLSRFAAGDGRHTTHQFVVVVAVQLLICQITKSVLPRGPTHHMVPDGTRECQTGDKNCRPSLKRKRAHPGRTRH